MSSFVPLQLDTSYQCSKLTVHTAPDAHISEAGRTVFGHVRPMWENIFTQFSLQYMRGVHRKIPGRTVSIYVHRRSAQNKTLISNTSYINPVWEYHFSCHRQGQGVKQAWSRGTYRMWTKS